MADDPRSRHGAAGAEHLPPPTVRAWDAEMIPAVDAIRRSRKNPHARWSGPNEGAALRLASGVVVPDSKPSFQMTGNEQFFAIGSCFARSIEERLELSGASVASRNIQVGMLGAATPRPGGIFNKYNPASMLQELQWAAGGATYPRRAPLQLVPDIYYDPQLRIASGTGSLDQIIERRQEVISYFSQVFQSDIVVITLGLVEAWYDRETELYLVEVPAAQAVRREPDRFAFDVVDVPRCVEILHEIRELLRRHGKAGLRIVLTVSPVPLDRTFTDADVIVANSLSKTTLRQAAEELVRQVDDVDYFPSYEAAMASHPDLVWTADRRHVTDFMVHQIVAAFMRRYRLGDEHVANAASAKPERLMTPEATLIRDLTFDLERYKTRIIELESQLHQFQQSSR